MYSAPKSQLSQLNLPNSGSPLVASMLPRIQFRHGVLMFVAYTGSGRCPSYITDAVTPISQNPSRILVVRYTTDTAHCTVLYQGQGQSSATEHSVLLAHASQLPLPRL